MNWKEINSEADLAEALNESEQKTVAIFKHSTRCSVSSMAKRMLESAWDLDDAEVQPYYLDLIAFRAISNKIAEDLDVIHQSPQLIGIRHREVFYHASHHVISVESLKSAL